MNDKYFPRKNVRFVKQSDVPNNRMEGWIKPTTGEDGKTIYTILLWDFEQKAWVPTGDTGLVAEEVLELLGIDPEEGEETLVLTKKGTFIPISDPVSALAYGVQWDTTISDPELTRIGSQDLHRKLPVQSAMRGCLLNDDGTVNYYLDPKDWTKKEDGTASNLDGTDGMVMVEIPEHYTRFETDGTKREKYISISPIPGFQKVPVMYISAYQAAVYRDGVNSKLASVKNTTTHYRGGTNISEWDGTYRSLLGIPASSISLTTFRSYARNRGNGSIWNQYTYQAYKTLYWLYVIEYANFDSQAEFNPIPTPEGFAQGGMGAGVTNLNNTHWSEFNGRNPFIPCGYTDEFGNKSGIKSFTMPDEYNEASGLVTDAPRYRGIEHPFGQVWHNVDGIKAMIQSVGDGGESITYLCDNPDNFHDSGYDHYRQVGLLPRADGWISEMAGDEIVPIGINNGSAAKFMCDHFSLSIPATGTDERAFRFGGSAFFDTHAGLASALTILSAAAASLGSRLCCHPNGYANT